MAWICGNFFLLVSALGAGLIPLDLGEPGKSMWPKCGITALFPQHPKTKLVLIYTLELDIST